MHTFWMMTGKKWVQWGFVLAWQGFTTIGTVYWWPSSPRCQHWCWVLQHVSCPSKTSSSPYLFHSIVACSLGLSSWFLTSQLRKLLAEKWIIVALGINTQVSKTVLQGEVTPSRTGCILISLLHISYHCLFWVHFCTTSWFNLQFTLVYCNLCLEILTCSCYPCFVCSLQCKKCFKCWLDLWKWLV